MINNKYVCVCKGNTFFGKTMIFVLFLRFFKK